MPDVETEDYDDEAGSWGGSVDEATGHLRVLSAKCATCIYRPGNLMHLQESRKEEMAAEAIAKGTWIVCHSTLPYRYDGEGNRPEVPPSVCRGYSDAERRSDGEHRSQYMQVAERLRWVTYVDPPIKER